MGLDYNCVLDYNLCESNLGWADWVVRTHPKVGNQPIRVPGGQRQLLILRCLQNGTRGS